MKISIDGRELEFSPGQTILEVATAAGIRIPTLCHLPGKIRGQHASCMVCCVRVNGNPNLVPSCVRPAEDGMKIDNDHPDLRDARRRILELILSDHIGDCEGPCENTCPARMEIPAMMRAVGEHQVAKALEVVTRDIALPATLGRICPEVCEKTCRRQVVDASVSICLVKRYVGDLGQAGAVTRPLPQKKPATGKSVAVVGAGPAGLAAAYYLLADGHAVTVFDQGQKPGGALRQIPVEKLPTAVLEAEIDLITRLGVTWKMNTSVGKDLSIADLMKSHQAAFLATGQVAGAAAQAMGLKLKNDKPAVNVATLESGTPGLFAGGDLVRQRKLAIRSLADGKIAAIGIGQFLAGQKITGETKRFNSRTGKLTRDEALTLVPGAAGKDGRLLLPPGAAGYPDDLAAREANRCLHCDCLAKDDCELRDLADEYGAKQDSSGTRRHLRPVQVGAVMVFEPGKCIACGKCVYICEDAGEDLGLTFTRRGFDLEITVPFQRPVSEAVTKVVDRVVEACPTGALSHRRDYGAICS